MNIKTAFIFLFLLFGKYVFPQCSFQDTSVPVSIRVDDLLSRLSLKEKASLMLYNSPAIERLNIPDYNWWNEALHGVARNGLATVFPQAVALSAGFDTTMVYEVATAISDEARVKHHQAVKTGIRSQYGGLTFWSPNINIFRDPRWGRGQETYGEDPFLTSSIARAFVHGMQGNNPVYLKTAACAKHFVVHSGPEPERHRFNAQVSESDLRNTYLPAFRAMVKCGVSTIMCAYNRTNNEPCCGSYYLLKSLLRDELGFNGQIVTDCWALSDIIYGHKTVKTEAEAAAMAVKAGVNLNCGYIYKFIPEAVEKKLITEANVDSILRPTLELRFRLGLFDPDDANPWSGIPEGVINCDKHRELARLASAKSIVLLKNNDRVLPLRKNIRSIFVTGPVAADISVLLGNYNGLSGNLVTILEGITGKVNPATSVQYRKGTGLTDSVYSGIYLASECEATIACIGITPENEGEEGDAMMSEYGGDRRSLSLPRNQVKFIKELRNTAKDRPLIAVVTGGGAIALSDIEHYADAIIFVWYPGEQGGNAIADILFGDYNPAGRLPVTFYRSEADLPPYESYNMQGRTYRYFTGVPDYPFGYGLSYSDFSYSNLSSGKSKMKAKDEIIVSVDVTNASDINGEEVVQLYIASEKIDSGLPVKELKGFQREMIPAGTTQKFSFRITDRLLERFDTGSKSYIVIKGKYSIMVGSSSSEKDLKSVGIIVE
jgi:beta-glucosidase